MKKSSLCVLINMLVKLQDVVLVLTTGLLSKFLVYRSLQSVLIVGKHATGHPMRPTANHLSKERNENRDEMHLEFVETFEFGVPPRRRCSTSNEGTLLIIILTIIILTIIILHT
jgi:hypothetical protein